MKIAFLLSALALVFGCKSRSSGGSSNIMADLAAKDGSFPMYQSIYYGKVLGYPDIVVLTDEIVKKILAGEITDDGKTKYLAEGDMLLTLEQVKGRYGTELGISARICEKGERWRNATVKYSFDGVDDDHRSQHISVIKEAMADWTAKTGIRFVEVDDADDGVNFVTSATDNTGCWSEFGRSARTVNLGSTCWNVPRAARHEIGHVMGLRHEQTRKDRDDFVDIDFGNIESEYKHNFEKEGCFDSNLPFDFNSVMLYGSFSFSKNGEPTIVKTNGDTFDAPQAISQWDARTIIQFYDLDGGDDDDDDDNDD
ncbi:MAG: M12 family metallopeptidase [Oligoflexales bacterium]